MSAMVMREANSFRWFHVKGPPCPWLLKRQWSSGWRELLETEAAGEESSGREWVRRLKESPTDVAAPSEHKKTWRRYTTFSFAFIPYCPFNASNWSMPLLHFFPLQIWPPSDRYRISPFSCSNDFLIFRSPALLVVLSSNLRFSCS